MTHSDNTSPALDTTVTHVPDRHRYELGVSGQPVGFTAYRDNDGRRIFFHTEIDDAFSGHGLSSILIRHALDDVRRSGLRIAAVCPLVAAYLKKHDDFEDITDPVTSEILEFIRSSTQ
ncbi:GNAT family N-acetyltransferase [Rhodococcus oxybenzonivorans]|uniref:GNAT family N-acetyltransferase n=1 Tax=Rhodococcus oxybenzonivorans TaxID=1990687 RepID=A0A2S2C2H0_9NOCA|nr:GNAT family N-acetyltransferase [Rhodococcus oxybenzonivorans]AWK74958.1 GNAT family N-acetyltransferase [Rhodococcus oxybenzonivorans]